MWWNPSQKADDELVEDEEEEDEEKEQPEEPEPETGPSLLSAISADESNLPFLPSPVFPCSHPPSVLCCRSERVPGVESSSHLQSGASVCRGSCLLKPLAWSPCRRIQEVSL